MVMRSTWSGCCRRIRPSERLRSFSRASRPASVFVPSVVDDDPDALGLLRVVLGTAGAEVVVRIVARRLWAAWASASPTRSSSISACQRWTDSSSSPGFGSPRIHRCVTFPRPRSPRSRARRNRAKALRSGFQLHLSKPVNPAELVAAIGTGSKDPRPYEAGQAQLRTAPATGVPGRVVRSRPACTSEQTPRRGRAGAGRALPGATGVVSEAGLKTRGHVPAASARRAV